jgi:hypothetical protein
MRKYAKYTKTSQICKNMKNKISYIKYTKLALNTILEDWYANAWTYEPF